MQLFKKFGLGIFCAVLLVQPALATEIVAISCPEGMLVVGDKRLTFTGSGKVATNDEGRKIIAVQPFILAAAGTLELLRAETRLGKNQKTCISHFDIVGTCAQALHALQIDSLTEPRCIDLLSEKIGSIVCSQINRIPINKSDVGKLFFSVFITKASKQSKRIELLTMDFFISQQPDGSLGININNQPRAYEPNNRGFYMIGSGWRALDRRNANPPTSSKAIALAWAEKDIINSHNKELQNGLATIGETADEFLIGYDGTIKVLQLNKRLTAAKTK